MSANIKSDNPSNEAAPRGRHITRYRDRRPDETQAQYLDGMTRAWSEMAKLMHRTRHPHEYR